mgnify:FL=1
MQNNKDFYFCKIDKKMIHMDYFTIFTNLTADLKW